MRGANRLPTIGGFFSLLGLALKYRWLILGLCVRLGYRVYRDVYRDADLSRDHDHIQIDPRPQSRQSRTTPRKDDILWTIAAFYQTQYDLLKSRSLAERVAANLDLAGAPISFTPNRPRPGANLFSLIFRTSESARMREILTQEKKRRPAWCRAALTVAPVPNSSLVRYFLRQPEPAMGPAHRRRRCG